MRSACSWELCCEVVGVRLIQDIALGLLLAVMVVMVVLFSSGQAERFVYGAF